jgi:hypothetical protein
VDEKDEEHDTWRDSIHGLVEGRAWSFSWWRRSSVAFLKNHEQDGAEETRQVDVTQESRQE